MMTLSIDGCLYGYFWVGPPLSQDNNGFLAFKMSKTQCDGKFKENLIIVDKSNPYTDSKFYLVLKFQKEIGIESVKALDETKKNNVLKKFIPPNEVVELQNNITQYKQQYAESLKVKKFIEIKRGEGSHLKQMDKLETELLIKSGVFKTTIEITTDDKTVLPKGTEYIWDYDEEMWIYKHGEKLFCAKPIFIGNQENIKK
jgi:hypothetical protein